MLDLTVVLLTYAGVKIYEKFIKDEPGEKQAAENPSEEQHRDEEKILDPEVPLEVQTDQEDLPRPEDPRALAKQKRSHYQQMSAVTLGTAFLRYISPTFTLVNIAAYTYTMLPFYRQVETAVRQRLLKDGKVDTHLLMGIGNLLLLGTGRYITAGIGLGFVYVGDAIQARASETAEKKLTGNLVDTLFDPHQKVWIVKEGAELESSLEAVGQGDILVIRAGETIPIDGQVVSGMASVDQHAFTGESYPVEKGIGEPVFASTLVLTGQVHVRVEKSGRETTIGRISEILDNSLKSKTELQLRGEQWAEKANLPFLVMAGAGLAVFGPVGAMVILSGNTIQAIRVLAPLATLNYQTVASHRQILVKQGQGIEQISAIDTFLFDKTGTLTDGDLEVRTLLCVHPDYGEKDILFYAALAEHQLTHPIAKAIVRHAREAGITVENLDDIEYRQGFGIVVQYRDLTIHVGSARFMDAEGIPLTRQTMSRQDEIHAQGHSLVMVAIGRRVAGLIELEARVRPEVLMVFSTLRQKGIQHIGIVSGDHAAPTRKLAEALGADSIFAEVLPEDKADIVRKFKSEGHTVCFIGDGVNDAIAMQQADLSISLRGATTLATDVADIILTDPDLTHLCELLKLSGQLENNLKRSLGICYLGMGVVLLGTLLGRIDILAAMGVHFALGTAAIGNAMMPLAGMKKRPSQPTREAPSDPAPSKPIVIVGAGAAGTACALAAAAQGVDVLVLEQSEQPGGIVAHTFIHTLGGLFDDQGEFLNPGLPVELAKRLSQASPLTRKRRIGKNWTLSVDPEVYARVTREWMDEYPGIEIRYNQHITGVSVANGKIESITVTQDGDTYTLTPHTVIDTTGRADIVRHVKNMGDTVDGEVLAGMIVRLRGVAPNAVTFPKSVGLLIRIRKAAERRELPPECGTIWLDSGVYPDEVYVKFNLKPADFNQARMDRVTSDLLAFLQTLPGFSQAVIDAGGQLGIRNGHQVQGDYTLTESDLKKGRRFPDAVCQACWPIEYWDPEQGVSLDHFPPGHRYDIPLCALKISGLDNLFTAGKCFSAEPRVQASARVVGTCWAMGQGLVNAIIKERETA
ncbi:heavy metal translocating P-type ATPase [Desulfobacter vibrioformis]|uniref:heavy metal translocating P-type ATPase n=1 Tax=Desulfobacter vibrioformis TaxID=34031 RepID=UPI00068C876F|nr:heavy metal translocating P-type ATPase [Desulfobacter vibrioformis]